MGTCSVDGCDKPSVAKGLCDKHRKRLARHGHIEATRPADWGDRTAHPLYKMWHGMIRRCEEETNKSFVNYGARGITVCDEWKDFWAFLADMGPRPSGRHSVERLDNTKGYSKENCCWATPAQQARNRRNAVITESLAKEIKRRAWRGEKAGDIARAMSLSYDQVRNVILGLSWGK